MIFEWLAREGWIILSWWALVTLAGAAVLPLCARLLGRLPDRGFTLARATGMLLVGFVFWLLASLGFLRNTTGSIFFSWLIVLIAGLVLYSRQPIDVRAWWRENRRVVIVAEVLFFTLLLGWAIVRAHQNNLTGTEKPMDLAFMSAVQRSDTFPPNDPWMAGYAISYYYFGYMMAAMLSMASGISSTIGFNMTIAMLFALTGVTAFGVVYNLVRSRVYHATGELMEKASSPRTAVLIGLLGTVFVVLMGNFQAALVEVPYQTRTASEDYLRYWGMPERTEYPEREQARAQGIAEDVPLTFMPVNLTGPQEARRAHWWWFRASRVLADYNLDGTFTGLQPIDEFPQFSFLLADDHPHVMSLPFAALALGLALNLLLTWRAPTTGEVVLYSLCIGGLIFLNTWDGPIYLFVLVGAEGLRRLMRNGTGRLMQADWVALVLFGVRLLVLALVFYLPFLIGFRSQASGLLPNLLHPTLFQQYFLMFGPFIVILVAFVWVESWRAGERMNWRLGLQAVGPLFGVLLLVTLALVLVAMLVPEVAAVVLGVVNESGGWDAVLPSLLARRVLFGVTIIVLLLGIAYVVGRLFPSLKWDSDSVEPEDRQVITYPAATGFALLLVGAGLVLSLIPEFVFLRDNFAARINTIFKFYYQVWLLFSVASAYAVYTLLADSRLRLPAPAVRAAFGALVFIVVALGMVYPALGIHNRMFLETDRASGGNTTPLTLDGGLTFLPAAYSDYLAIMCLSQLVTTDEVVIVEAIGPPYHSEYGRVGALTGLPILLGWENHEGQWRGATYGAVKGTRPEDIQRLYTDPRWETAQAIINQYDIDYIFYGVTERSDYGVAGEEKFIEHLEPVCEREGSVFYYVPAAEVAAR